MSTSLLIVDDSLSCLTLSTLIMKEQSLRVVGVSNTFEEAYKKLTQKQPQYILLDPHVLSLQELSQLEKAAQEEHANIIVFSKNAQHPLALIARFIQKPDKLSTQTFSVSSILHAVNENNEMIPVVTSAQTPSASTVKKQVMLIDDSALMKVAISNVLKGDPQLRLLCSASNGQEGLEKLKEHNPDIILLDLEMPVMGGEEFLKAARSKTKAKIIVISSIAHTRATQLKALGADAFIDKPSGSVSMDFRDKTGEALLELIHSLI